MAASPRDEDLISIVCASVISLPFVQALPRGSNFVSGALHPRLAGQLPMSEEHFPTCSGVLGYGQRMSHFFFFGP
jgi:hypothetical protein